MTLRDKLEALTGPCREVDAEIAEALTGEACVWSRPICGYRFADGGAEVPHYTAILDAVVELVEREMQGKKWSVVRYENNDTITTIGDDADDAWAEHKLPAVALLLALLDAKEVE